MRSVLPPLNVKKYHAVHDALGLSHMPDLILVDVNELVVGTRLGSPIHDRNGSLLLRTGTIITSEIKRRLIQRNIQEVALGEKHAHLSAPLSAEDESVGDLERQLSQRIEAVLHSGASRLKDAGPAVKDQVIRHGCQSYDAELRSAFRLKNERDATLMDQSIDDSLRGCLQIAFPAARQNSIMSASLIGTWHARN